MDQKKLLVEGSIISCLRYGLEVVSAGNETAMNRLSSMQSKAARYVLSKSRKEWSKSEGFMELNWLTLPQMAVEASLKLFFKVLWRKKPEKIFRSIFDSNQNQMGVSN